MARNAFALVLAAHHKARDVLQKHERYFALAAQLDKVCAFLCAFRKQDSVVGNDAYRHAFNVCKAAHQRGAVARLELMKHTAIDDTGDDFMHVIGLARVNRNHAVQLLGAVQGRCRRTQHLLAVLLTVQAGHRQARQGQCMRVVLRQVVRHA